MEETQINTDTGTRAQLNSLAGQANVSRAAFLRLLVTRYGDRLVSDLTEPARVEAAIQGGGER
jgi:hypothetical protein